MRFFLRIVISISFSLLNSGVMALLPSPGNLDKGKIKLSFNDEWVQNHIIPQYVISVGSMRFMACLIIYLPYIFNEMHDTARHGTTLQVSISLRQHPKSYHKADLSKQRRKVGPSYGKDSWQNLHLRVRKEVMKDLPTRVMGISELHNSPINLVDIICMSVILAHGVIEYD